MKATSYDIIVRPVLTEKTYDFIADKRYVFEVDIRANKTQIKQALEDIFGVRVQSVNTVRTLGKIKRQGAHSGRRPTVKKAYVKLTPASKGIEFFENMVQ
jgi:large subunit ribosomal protein L23